MKITVNGTMQEVQAAQLDAALQELGYDGAARVATALNGAFVAQAMRAQTQLQAGDMLEVVAPRQGG